MPLRTGLGHHSESWRSLSENQFHCELHRARPAGLIKRAEHAKSCRQGASGLTKCASRPTCAIGRVDGAKVWMVEDIESLGTELQPKFFANRKFSPHGEVHLPSTKPPHKIPRSITDLSGRGKCKSGRIDRSAAGVLRPIQKNWLAWQQIKSTDF